MRLVSNPESVRRGEPSALAIAETIIASGFSFWLAWRFGSIQHIVVASALAPFLLLRTRLSTWYAMRIFTPPLLLNWRALGIPDPAVFRFLVFLFWAPIAKLIAAIQIFLRRPLKCIVAIPRNFVRNIAVVDFAFSPRFFPGSDEIKHSPLRMASWYRSAFGYDWLIDMNLYGIIEMIHAEKAIGSIDKIFNIIIFLPLLIAALVYRWALKSTALLWLPLIWVVIQARPRAHLVNRLTVMVRSAWSKTMLAYSTLVLVAFIAKIALIVGIWRLANLDWLGPLGIAATRLAAPFELPLWQVAAALNALLAYAFFFRADRHLLAQGTAEAWPEVWIEREYAVFQVVRTTLSLYVVACTFYIAAAVAWQAEWPPIRFVLFPWTG